MAAAPILQLTLDNLEAARAQIPTGLWTALKHKEQLFVAAYLADPEMRKEAAAISAGFRASAAGTNGTRMLRRPTVQAAVAVAIEARAKRVGVNADAVLDRVRAIAFADANALTSFRRSCCRYCHGVKHEYQRTPAQMRRDRATWEKAQTKQSKDEFDEAGGDGYDRRKPPHPDCPECFGEGEGSVFIADTRHLTGDAAVLYAGMKETDKGIEIKVRDQDGALTNLMRHLGLFAEKPEAPEDADARAKRIRDALDEMDLRTTGKAA